MPEQAFREDQDAWLTGPMHVCVNNLRQVAVAADDEAKRAGRQSEALENCGTQLQKCFSAALQGQGAMGLILLPMSPPLTQENR